MIIDWDRVETRVLKSLAKPHCSGCQHSCKNDSCILPDMNVVSVAERGYCDYYEEKADITAIKEILVMRKLGKNL